MVPRTDAAVQVYRFPHFHDRHGPERGRAEDWYEGHYADWRSYPKGSW